MNDWGQPNQVPAAAGQEPLTEQVVLIEPTVLVRSESLPFTGGDPTATVLLGLSVLIAGCVSWLLGVVYR